MQSFADHWSVFFAIAQKPLVQQLALYRGEKRQKPRRRDDKPDVQTKCRRRIARAYPSRQRESFERLELDVQHPVANISALTDLTKFTCFMINFKINQMWVQGNQLTVDLILDLCQRKKV